MKYNKLATVLCSAALGLLALTSCEGGDLFGINSPDWLSSKADSIAAEKAKNQGGDEIIEGMQEDVYTIGATDYSTGIAVLLTIRNMEPSATTINPAETLNGVVISTVVWLQAIWSSRPILTRVLTSLAVR